MKTTDSSFRDVWVCVCCPEKQQSRSSGRGRSPPARPKQQGASTRERKERRISPTAASKPVGRLVATAFRRLWPQRPGKASKLEGVAQPNALPHEIRLVCMGVRGRACCNIEYMRRRVPLVGNIPIESLARLTRVHHGARARLLRAYPQSIKQQKKCATHRCCRLHGNRTGRIGAPDPNAPTRRLHRLQRRMPHGAVCAVRTLPCWRHRPISALSTERGLSLEAIDLPTASATTHTCLGLQVAPGPVLHRWARARGRSEVLERGPFRNIARNVASKGAKRGLLARLSAKIGPVGMARRDRSRCSIPRPPRPQASRWIPGNSPKFRLNKKRTCRSSEEMRSRRSL